MGWIDVPLKGQLATNLDPTAVSRLTVEFENAFVTDVGSVSRFPGLRPFVSMPTPGPVYLEEWRGDLIAVTSGGHVYRIGKFGEIQNITGAAVVGGRRPTFARTEDELLIAAGSQIIRLAGERTEILSEQAPETSHVVFVSGYLIAIELRSGRFRHSKPGSYTEWDDLDVFSAEGRPDDLVGAIATEFDELLLVGPESIEQFDAAPNGEQPFFRRWSVGTGVYQDALYTLTNADNAVWAINKSLEWARISGQTSTPASGQIQKELESVDDWSNAWAIELGAVGQRFQIIQAPNATTRYGTKGMTWLYDYRQRRWSTLYGWDDVSNLPTRWPGWSHKFLSGRHYVGGDGVIYLLDETANHNAGKIQRFLWRSGHIDSERGRGMRVDGLRIRCKRGAIGANDKPGQISVRANRDNRGFSRAWRKSMGAMGQRNMVIEWGPMGVGDTWQFEVEITDPVPIEIVSIQANITPVS